MPTPHRFRKQIVLLALLISSSCIAFSQAKLGMFFSNLPDTAYMQTSSQIKVTVTNTGSALFNGTIDIYYSTDPVYTPVFLGSIISAILNPGDTISLITTILIDSAYFNTGNNIVVVWPTSSGIATSYQSWEIINVKIMPAGINEPYHTLMNLNVYPNPASSVLFVESAFLQYTFESVRILDLSGNEVKYLSGISSSGLSKIILDIFSLPAGFYLLECADRNGRLYRTKFIKNSQ